MALDLKIAVDDGICTSDRRKKGHVTVDVVVLGGNCGTTGGGELQDGEVYRSRHERGGGWGWG